MFKKQLKTEQPQNLQQKRSNRSLTVERNDEALSIERIDEMFSDAWADEEEIDDIVSYEALADVYDLFMQDIPYDTWCEQIDTFLRQYAPKPQQDQVLDSERNLIVDLGCGTGAMTIRLAQKGYDMIGIDRSPQMLTIAQSKADALPALPARPLFLLQDMRELDLYSTVGAFISICDAVNYLLEDGDMRKVFEQVNTYLYPGGIFIFDFHTPYYYQKVIGESTIAQNHENAAVIWENIYDSQTNINQYDVTIFTKDQDDRFIRHQEIHYQRAYTPAQIQTLLEQANLELLTMCDEATLTTPQPDSQRIYVVARETMKGNNLGS
ncbi:MAG: class I SAM-dependent methyltransferase [Clostridium sp.]|jgi:SAM-dependent methyltransferase|nr:class I SAM-dependent methyltransferase [Clostridium sp.]